MSIVKKEARLSSILLARKGSAEPAYTDHRLTKQLHDTGARADNDLKPSYNDDLNKDDKTSLSSLEDIIREVQKVSERQHNGRIHSDNLKEISETVEKSIGSITNIKKPMEKANIAKKRIAMTLRMEHDDHLKLRLYAAHSRKSCQEIISEALNHYLNQSDTVCDLSSCKCLSR